jgi:hypothetical protein
MQNEERVATIHFAIPCTVAGEMGMLTAPMSGAAPLPDVLKKDMRAKPGMRIRFACSQRKMPNTYNLMSNVACMVNCAKCRATQAWIDAPDDGADPKDPEKGFQEPEDIDDE